MGATITQEHGYLEARVEQLHGAHLLFDKITVTGTEDLLMAAVLAEGETLMENCAREPEVADLAALLTAMAQKSKAPALQLFCTRRQPAAWRALPHQPDRIEAGTFLVAALLPAEI